MDTMQIDFKDQLSVEVITNFFSYAKKKEKKMKSLKALSFKKSSKINWPIKS